jgi:hypothetical protein
MRRALAVGGAFVGICLVGYALFASESDEERILASLVALEDALRTTEGGTNPIFANARFSDAFEDIFHEQVHYSIPELTTGSNGRKSLVRLATQSTVYFSTLDVSFGGTDVELDRSGAAADVETLATIRATRGGSPERDERKVRFAFIKSDGDWLISEVRVFAKDEEAEAGF